jgi:hypothetical protein
VSEPPRAERRGRDGRYLAVTAIALMVAVYLAFQLIGFLFKLLFLAAAVVIGLSAYRAWKGSP